MEEHVDETTTRDTDRLVPSEDEEDLSNHASGSHTSSPSSVPGPNSSDSEPNCCGRFKFPSNPRYRIRLRLVGVILFAIFLTLFIVCVVMMSGTYKSVIYNMLHKELEIVPGSKSFDIWKQTPIPLTLSFYFFNLTNPKEFQNGSKPILQEIGPYVYMEYHNKTNITFNDNSTVSYYQKRWWIWDQQASGNLSHEDIFCVVNTVPVAAAYQIGRHPLVLSSLNMLLQKLGEPLIIYKSVREVVFDGYKDPLLDFVHNITTVDDYDGLKGHEKNISQTVSLLPANLLKYDKMAWFYKRNMSTVHDGHFTMFTGKDSLKNLGKMDLWNGTKETDYYPYPCNKIAGSAGELWPPKHHMREISLYSPDLCITLTLPYKEQMKKFNIKGSRFWGSNDTFANPRYNPENLCQCYQRELSNCPPSGLLDAQTCNMGAPAFVSFPHFLHGDPALLKGVEGVSPPNASLHQFHIDLIPRLGVPLNVNARVQINMKIKPYKGNGFGIGKISMLADVTEVILPMLWFELSASITEDMSGGLHTVVSLLKADMWAMFFVISVAAVFGMMVSLTFCILNQYFFK